MSGLHTAFHLPDGRVLVNTERGRYTEAPPGFFGTETPRVEVVSSAVKDAVVPAFWYSMGALVELIAVGEPGVWIRTHPSCATIECPYCLALPGQPCMSRNGWAAMVHHFRAKSRRGAIWNVYPSQWRWGPA
jgi:hypothetical protein